MLFFLLFVCSRSKFDVVNHILFFSQNAEIYVYKYGKIRLYSILDLVYHFLYMTT